MWRVCLAQQRRDIRFWVCVCENMTETELPWAKLTGGDNRRGSKYEWKENRPMGRIRWETDKQNPAFYMILPYIIHQVTMWNNDDVLTLWQLWFLLWTSFHFMDLITANLHLLCPKMANMGLLFTTQKFDGRVVGILKSFLAMSL